MGKFAAWYVRGSYLPPLLIYLAAGLSGLTGIVSTFFVKDYLDLPAEFIASLAFWATLPWSLKILLGHLVDRLWQLKAWLVVLGAALVTVSLAIMLGLLTHRQAMASWLPVQTWYVISSVLAPLGYVLQDVVADAMTIEAVPRVLGNGEPVSAQQAKLMHTTMQALARGTLIVGSVLVSVVNLVLFSSTSATEPSRIGVYQLVYQIALFIPLLSVMGVALAGVLHRRPQITNATAPLTQIDRRIALGGLGFAVVAAWVGLSRVAHAELLVFLLSFAILTALMRKLLLQLDQKDRQTLIATALLLFVFRAMPDPGPAPTWWIIDHLGGDGRFFAMLSLLGGLLAIAGLYLFRRFMAQRSVAFTVIFLTLVWAVLSLPAAGMYCCGLQEWTASHTQGVIGGRAIVVVDTSLMALLSEIAMVPMLAWIARTAPVQLKATYFAVMVSFANLGLSLSQVGSEYLNHIFVVTREVRNADTGAIVTHADYSELGALYLTSIALALLLPLLMALVLRVAGYRSA
ncbi:hypothetical protein [Pseudomonas putida]